MNFVSTANQIRQRTEIRGELEAVMMFYSRNYFAILLELLLFRYLIYCLANITWPITTTSNLNVGRVGGHLKLSRSSLPASKRLS